MKKLAVLCHRCGKLVALGVDAGLYSDGTRTLALCNWHTRRKLVPVTGNRLRKLACRAFLESFTDLIADEGTLSSVATTYHDDLTYSLSVVGKELHPAVAEWLRLIEQHFSMLSLLAELTKKVESEHLGQIWAKPKPEGTRRRK